MTGDTSQTPGPAGAVQVPPAVPGFTLGSRTARAPGLGSAPAAVVAAAGAEPGSGPRTAGGVPGGLPPSAAPVVGAGAGDLPRLGEIVRDAERYLAQAARVLRREEYDPASAPSAEDEPHGLAFVEVRRLCALADIKSALRMLAEITELGLPPVGSAVHVRPPVAGEGRTPGLVDSAPAMSAEASGVDALGAAYGSVTPSGHDTPGVAGPTPYAPVAASFGLPAMPGTYESWPPGSPLSSKPAEGGAGSELWRAAALIGGPQFRSQPRSDEGADRHESTANRAARVPTSAPAKHRTFAAVRAAGDGRP